MTELDYSKYSIEQLRDALAHINKTSYPERFARLQKELESRQDSYSETEPVGESPDLTAVSNWLAKAASRVTKAAPFVALAIVANALLGALTRFSIPQLGFGLTFRVAHDNPDANKAIAMILFWGLLALFAVGGSSVFIKHKFPKRTLFLAWALVSFQLKLGSLVWFPSFAGWMSYHLKYQSLSGNEITFAIQIVLVPLFLAAATAWGATEARGAPNE